MTASLRAADSDAPSPSLVGVRTSCAAVDGPLRILAAAIGSAPQRPSPVVHVFTIGDAELSVAERSRDASLSPDGVRAVVLRVADPGARAADVRRCGARVEESADRFSLLANGLTVELLLPGHSPRGHGASAVELDHVALLVGNLEEAVDVWSAITGLRPAMVGPHPLGGSDAARFLLGNRMVELICPWDGATTPMRKRLDSSGEGPLALALVAKDLAATMEAVEDAGATLVRQPPHVFIHPHDTGGVLVQVTPRLLH